MPGFTVKQICPADVDPAFARPDVTDGFYADAAGEVSQSGKPVLKVLAAQLKSGNGDGYVHTFLSGLTSDDPAKTVASETQVLGGHEVTYFNVPVGASGYTYAQGAIAVIAYTTPGAPVAVQRDAFSKVIANVR